MIRVKFAWYDIWIGLFVDAKKRILYICPLPTLLIEVHLNGKSLDSWPKAK